MMSSGRRTGFTLIEMLMVVVVIGILLGLLSTAILRARHNAKRTRAAADRKTLLAAVQAFHHEYGAWPCPAPSGSFEDRVYGGEDDYGENSVVIGLLRPESGANKHNIQFLNLGEYRFDSADGTYESGANVVDPWKNPYRITFSFTNEAASVE
jgi:prepilin-type N-terminal cleavage/methylation domain-containing protein